MAQTERVIPKIRDIEDDAMQRLKSSEASCGQSGQIESVEVDYGRWPVNILNST